MSVDGERLSFSPAQLQAFADASGDVNPLHVDPVYARTTLFGEQVVYGNLIVLTLLARIKARAGQRVGALDVQFESPAFLGRSYELSLDEQPDHRLLARLSEQGRDICRVEISFSERRAAPARRLEEEGGSAELRKVAAMRDEQTLTALQLGGRYCPAKGALVRLRAVTGIDELLLDDAQLSALLCASYVVGMEAPGKAALFDALTLTFDECPGPLADLSWSLRVGSYDERFGLMRATLELVTAGGRASEAEISAIARPAPPPPSLELIRASGGSHRRLAGKVAAVTGGTRGLGASLALALAQEGCALWLGSRGATPESDALARTLSEVGAAFSIVGADWSDAEVCRRASAEIRERAGRLDVAVLNAFPLSPTCRTEPGAVPGIVRYVRDSVQLTLAPMAAFLELLAESHGCLILISTSYVNADASPGDLPHYVAAKRAVEGLVFSASRAFPDVRFIVERPPPLLTIRNSSPLARTAALRTEPVAVRIVDHLCRGAVAGKRLEVYSAYDPLAAMPIS